MREKCPYCGETLKPKALGCPACGSDEQTGWAVLEQTSPLIEEDVKDEKQEGKDSGAVEKPNAIWWNVAIWLFLALTITIYVLGKVLRYVR